MKKTILGLFFAFLLATPFSTAKADGGMVVPPGRWIQETGQKAVIVSENGVETLILSTSYRGDAEDFAWIIPTPSRPEVSKGAVGIFEALEEMTNVYQSSNRIYENLSFGARTLDMAPTTTVLEQKKIGFYDVAILESNDKDSLYNWFKKNGYNYPEHGKYILDDYIQNKWYFTAVKINDENTAQARDDLKSGSITPLKLVFKTDKIVFPLKISSVTMNEPKKNTGTESSEMKEEIAPIYPSNFMDVQLYIFADHKKKVGDFYTRYARWVGSSKIRDLALDDNGNPWYSPKAKKMFLTVLTDSMSTKDMKSDLFLTNEKDNDPVPPSQFWTQLLLTILFTLIIIVSPFGLVYIILMLLFIFIKSETLKKVFWYGQGLISLFGLGISALLIIFLIQDPASAGEFISIVISVILSTVAMIFGMVLEIARSKKAGTYQL